ncbi:MAG: sulfotransferase [Cyanothece sp. SIO1E1]|nr:sulfotransferase [Cyanothece sp. SIO1E1]
MTVSVSLAEPIFLVGAERSGTTVLRLMLDHHPELAWCNEFEYAVDQISDSNNWPNLNHYLDWLETHRIFQSTGFEIDQCLNYPQLVNSFLCQKRDRAEKPLIGATVHRHFDRVLRIWPNARFIHIVRDGRDVARSCIGMGWAGNVWTGIERWIEAECLWDHLCQQVPTERRIELTYEALIAEPVETLTRLCAFIGIPYQSAMMSYSRTTTYDFPDARFIGRWKHQLSDHEIQLVESRIADKLLKHGYELSGLPALKVTPAMRQRIKWQDWWARAQFRWRRNGLPLFLSSYLSRRLGIKAWQKHVQLKINVIETGYLK